MESGWQQEIVERRVMNPETPRTTFCQGIQTRLNVESAPQDPIVPSGQSFEVCGKCVCMADSWLEDLSWNWSSHELDGRKGKGVVPNVIPTILRWTEGLALLGSLRH